MATEDETTVAEGGDTDGEAEAQAPAQPGEAANGDAVAAEAVEQDLDALVEDLRRERDEYLDLAQRARADFDNYRRRAAREAEEAELRGKTSVVRGILSAVDNLERALASDAGGDTLAEGVTLVHRELTTALASAGVETFDPAGEAFDPESCEAISTRPAADGEASGIVAETLQRGYRAGETLIRPARVVVTA